MPSFFCSQCLASNPENLAIRYQFGVAQSLQRRTQEAIDTFTECIQREADFAECHVELGNVLNNLKQHGQISRTVRSSESELKVIITDNGPGISPNDLEHIFDPFYTTRTQGTGLGLAVVQAVAKAHGGLVQLNSKPFKGSEFILTMPLEKKQTNQLDITEHQHQQIA